MGAKYYSNWTIFWVLIGVALLIAGTARDSWTDSAVPEGDLIYNPQANPANFPPNTAQVPNRIFVHPHLEFGTLNYRESAAAGYGYSGICPRDRKKDDMNEISSGMVAMILLAGILGFFASFTAFLAASNSQYVTTLKPTKTLSLFAFIFTLVCWALWLRAQTVYLDKGKNATNDCRYRGVVGNRSDAPIDNAERELAGSFALMVIACFLYLVLFVWSNKLMRTHGENAPAERRVVTLLLCLAALGCVIASTQYNVWSRASPGGSEDKVEAYVENLFGFRTNNTNDKKDDRLKANVRVDAEARYGVFSARYEEEYTFPYADVQNREYICRNPDLTKDDSGQFIVLGGRVTLAFACLSCVFGLIALVFVAKHNSAGFWMMIYTFMAGVVAIVVWKTAVDPAIRQNCCEAPHCENGTSLSLIAAGLAAIALAVFHQAYVMLNDVYVFHAPSRAHLGD